MGQAHGIAVRCNHRRLFGFGDLDRQPNGTGCKQRCKFGALCLVIGQGKTAFGKAAQSIDILGAQIAIGAGRHLIHSQNRVKAVDSCFHQTRHPSIDTAQQLWRACIHQNRGYLARFRRRHDRRAHFMTRHHDHIRHPMRQETGYILGVIPRHIIVEMACFAARDQNIYAMIALQTVGQTRNALFGDSFGAVNPHQLPIWARVAWPCDGATLRCQVIKRLADGIHGFIGRFMRPSPLSKSQRPLPRADGEYAR